MKLWRFSDPGDERYARASRVGTFDDDTDLRVKPLVIEWEPDSDIVGDFIWPGFDSDIMVTKRVGDLIQAAGITGIELGQVKMRENSEASKRRSKARRVQLPYKGPALRDLFVVGSAALDRARSSLKIVKGEDGSEEIDVTGIETWDEVWNEKKTEFMLRHRKRVAGKGIFVRAKVEIFRIPEFPNWIFCSNVVKTFVEKQGFNNVSFLEMGDVL